MNPKRSLWRWALGPPRWRLLDGVEPARLPRWLRPAFAAALVVVGLLGLAGVLLTGVCR